MTKTFISEFKQQENVKQKHHMIYKHVSCEFKQHECLKKTKTRKRSHDTNTF